jgi:DNA mismatch endonuclease, patch repair protein
MPSVLPKILPRRKRAPLSRSEMMSRIRSKDTRPEVVTRAAIHSLGIRFRKHRADLPGKPDIANARQRWAIFVHGCFWHSHKACKLASDPKSNRGYWVKKLKRNQVRDRERIAALRKLGFKILIIWECDVRNGKRLQTKLRAFFG